MQNIGDVKVERSAPTRMEDTNGLSRFSVVGVPCRTGNANEGDIPQLKLASQPLWHRR